ncbi:MAG: hypothetical protein E6H58_15255 [Betaproteobacteria bacterium]|nr:MAG: hypothetical protein E6H65_13450 [Betaproteobacteria bacterium]TMH29962.1 MAG: hypothetical protein E6H58_15255 [Betaproteobacteria bacterium]
MQAVLQRATRLLATIAASALFSGCMTTSVLTFAYEQSTRGTPNETCLSVGCAATAVLSYVVDKAQEGEPTPCHSLNSVQRALIGRCGRYEAGSLVAKDVMASGLPRCPLVVAAREPRFWPVLPELLAKGALPEACDQAPLAALAQLDSCPNFSVASPAALQAIRWLAEADSQAIQHDVMRMLSCPSARAVGLDSVLDDWLAQGLLPAQGLAFSPLGALHPDHLGSSFARALEQHGHRANAALAAHPGVLPAGFDLALRNGHRPALDWWLDRLPQLANRVPATQANQLPWLPLARVITPNYLTHPERQTELVAYLMARGANPWRALPHDPGQSVVSYARALKSPSLDLLDPPMNWTARAAAISP